MDEQTDPSGLLNVARDPRALAAVCDALDRLEHGIVARIRTRSQCLSGENSLTTLGPDASNTHSNLISASSSP